MPGGSRDASLSSGTAGFALFFDRLAHSERATGEDASWRDQCVQHTVDAVATEALDETFYRGMSGIAWVLQQFLPADSQGRADDLTQVDELLGACVAHKRDLGIDLISGLVGIGVYFLERLPAPGAIAGVESVVEALYSRAERGGPGEFTWRDPMQFMTDAERQEFPEGRYDLGLAHGVAGIVAFLARAKAAGLLSDQGRELMDGAVPWLMRQAREGSSVFPYWIAPVGREPDTNLAWCYGDVGISSALLNAALATDQPSWRSFALRLADRCVDRSRARPPLVEAGLCHGSTGLAHQFNRLYRATGQMQYLETAKHWYQWTLALRVPGTGFGGFTSTIRDAQRRSVGIASPEFLNGGAGIGLGLLAGLEPTDPGWDRTLLISSLNRQCTNRAVGLSRE